MLRKSQNWGIIFKKGLEFWKTLSKKVEEKERQRRRSSKLQTRDRT
jgi:hypothetical protein